MRGDVRAHTKRSALCRDLQRAAEFADETAPGPRIGSRVSVIVQEERAYGLVCDLPQHASFVGLIAPAQQGAAPAAAGSTLEAVVLDVHALDGIVDLSARQVRPSSLQVCVHGSHTALPSSYQCSVCH